MIISWNGQNKETMETNKQTTEYYNQPGPIIFVIAIWVSVTSFKNPDNVAPSRSQLLDLMAKRCFLVHPEQAKAREWTLCKSSSFSDVAPMQIVFRCPDDAAMHKGGGGGVMQPVCTSVPVYQCTSGTSVSTVPVHCNYWFSSSGVSMLKVPFLITLMVIIW